jgi:hypothetical protein
LRPLVLEILEEGVITGCVMGLYEFGLEYINQKETEIPKKEEEIQKTQKVIK